MRQLRAVVSAPNWLPTDGPPTIRDVRPTTIYDLVPPEGRAGIERARAAAALNRVSRKMDAVIQRLDDLADATEERRKERRRRGR